jgi:hypothetical protein
MGETEIQIAINMFEENAQHVDPINGAFYYNLNNGLLAMARALSEMQQSLNEIKKRKP